MGYAETDLVRIAKRENNTKRKYLVVNPLQGKHVPVSPTKALSLFTSLVDTFRNQYAGETLLLIGFAETATAIGAQAAVSIGANYIQTTREIIPDAEYLFFSEEHSHATEQKLVKNDIDEIIAATDRVIFIEDELTTGKTILNIIDIFEKMYSRRLKFSVASLLNGMKEEHLQLYRQKEIQLHYLIKTNHDTYGKQAEAFAGNGNYYTSVAAKPVDEIKQILIGGRMDARRLLNAADYKDACEHLWDLAHKAIGNVSRKKILVIGTEEFMYPALYIGKKLEELDNTVLCHSTTRSPVEVSLEDGYPLHSRYELKSLYDCNRRTFLYDIGKNDKVFIITDAPGSETEGLDTLINALSMHNTDITVIRWC